MPRIAYDKINSRPRNAYPGDNLQIMIGPHRDRDGKVWPDGTSFSNPRAYGTEWALDVGRDYDIFFPRKLSWWEREKREAVETVQNTGQYTGAALIWLFSLAVIIGVVVLAASHL